MVDVQMLKDSLRLEGNDDDALLTGYLNAAQNYIQDAIGQDVEKFYEDNPLYDTAVIALASSYYTNRVATSSTQVYTVNLVLRSIIGQLRGKYDQEVERNEEDKSVTDDL